MKRVGRVIALISLLLLAGVLVVPFVPSAGIPAVSTANPPPTPIRDYVLLHGPQQTGATNLVTALYLGYRLYDTLGEAIVLLLAESAVLFVLEVRE